MTEMSGNVKQFAAYLNQVFPGGALFLAATDAELKRLLMELTTELLQEVQGRRVCSARIIGMNDHAGGTDDTNTWVLSPTATISSSGILIQPENAPVLWLERPTSSSNPTNLLLNESLACSIVTPLDSGEALLKLIETAQAFMPENFISTMASMAACIMAASYKSVIAKCGCSGVPILYGNPGSCKSEALKCGLSLFGAHNTHFYNSQTTPSFLFAALKQTTVPIGLDDINGKAQDTWEELVIDSYNNTARGTHAYNTECFKTMPVLTSNWRFESKRQRAHMRCIVIPFFEHSDEPNATALYEELNTSRDKVSASVGEIINLCSSFDSPSAQKIRNEKIFPHVSAIFTHSHARFKTTMTVFMYFFLEVS